jgi:hypothetical protein
LICCLIPAALEPASSCDRRELLDFGVQDCFFVGGAQGALAFAAGGAALDVFEEGVGGPGVVLFGVVEATLALIEGDGVVVHGFVCRGVFDDCVGQHLFEFSTGGAGHNAGILAASRDNRSVRTSMEEHPFD